MSEMTKIEKNLAGIKRRWLVMSGKGGVGKSTVTAQLAVRLAAKGWKVGVLDADLHGPSQSGIFGMRGQQHTAVGDRIQPFTHGPNVKVVTMQGLLNTPDEALIWRGPLKIGLIQQLLGDTDWGNLDVLLMDSPPGTGDEPLTLVQDVPQCEGIVVTTPQEVSLADVRKSLNFAAAVKLPLRGLIENMSGFICPDCGHCHYPFGQGGGEKLAAERNISFLGALPLDPLVMLGGDQGLPDQAGSPACEEAWEQVIAKLMQE